MILQVNSIPSVAFIQHNLSGSYIVQAEVRNGYVDEVQTTTLNIENSFESNIVADNPVQSSNVGQSATYNLEVVNPTTSITVYNIVPQTASGVAISTDSIITFQQAQAEQ